MLKLTPLEASVLTLLRKRLSYREVADALGHSNIYWILYKLRRKFGIGPFVTPHTRAINRRRRADPGWDWLYKQEEINREWLMRLW